MKNIQSIPGSDDILRIELPNQIVLLARENSLSPSVVISGYLPGGSVLDPVDRSGLAIFLSLALMRGTETNSFEQIFRKLEDNGASLVSTPASILSVSRTILGGRFAGHA